MPTKSNKVIVWSQPACPNCTNAKKLLDKENYEYEEYVIGVTATKEDFMEATNNARGVPQIIIDGVCINGYRELIKFLRK